MSSNIYLFDQVLGDQKMNTDTLFNILTLSHDLFTLFKFLRVGTLITPCIIDLIDCERRTEAKQKYLYDS